MTLFHVSNAGLAPGTVLQADHFSHKPKISAFFRAMVQGPEVFASTLIAAQYADEIRKEIRGGVPWPTANKWATEGLVEYVRIFYFDGRPPRWESVFLFESQALAERFILDFRKDSPSSIYCCEAEGEYVLFRTDMTIFTEINRVIAESLVRERLVSVMPRLITMAHEYWTASASPQWPEILMRGGTARIVERVY